MAQQPQWTLWADEPDVYLDELEEQEDQALSSLPSLRHRLLTGEEELELGQRIEEGDEEARNTLIESNVRLVYSIASRYRHTGVPLEDLIQEGFIGLIHAVDRFDHRRGCRFSTCASSWIRAYILQAIQNLRPLVHLPQRVALKVKKMWRLREELLHELHREPRLEEIAHRASLPLDQVEHLLRMAQTWVSLEEPIGEEGDTMLAEILEDAEMPSPEEQVMSLGLRDQIEKDLQQLTPQEAEVIRLRFGLDDGQERTLEQIGRRFSLTRQRIKEIENRALRKMRCLGCAHLEIELMCGALDPPPAHGQSNGRNKPRDAASHGRPQPGDQDAAARRRSA